MPDTLLTETTVGKPLAIEKLQSVLRQKSEKNKNLRKSLRELQKAHERSLYMLEVSYQDNDHLQKALDAAEQQDDFKAGWILGALLIGFFGGGAVAIIFSLIVHFIR